MNQQLILTGDRVGEIFEKCLQQETDDPSQAVKVEDIGEAVFNQGRLEEHRSQIEEMLAQLPDEFKKSGGGGWSFLNACQDRHGILWTGFQARVGQLFALGIGIGKVENQIPREMWNILPGGMPYYVVLD